MLGRPPEHLPERLHPIWNLAHNLWWSWHRRARELFRQLDFNLWLSTQQNPVAMLREIDPVRLQEAAEDPSFLRLFDDVIASFEEDMAAPRRRLTGDYEFDPDRPIAYFSAEFGVHSSVPVYSGGLGVLAGDHCREASDLHLPLVGVGLLYQKGYFHQKIKANGMQEAVPEVFEPEYKPLIRIIPDNGAEYLAEVRIEDRVVRVAAWRMDLGFVSIYLLDTDVNGNDSEDRELTAQLYSGDDRMRIRQEMILGIGGVRILRALGIRPSFWHLNEGHTAFLSLERLREKLDGGESFEEGLEAIRRNSLFTTHTPVPAGHDRFSRELAGSALGHFMDRCGATEDQVFSLADEPGNGAGVFSMAALAFRTTGYHNGVSARHGEVARRMWHKMWPELPVEEVPIPDITNGVHVSNWVCREIRNVLDRQLGPEWMERQQEKTVWDLVADIPGEYLWHAHQERKVRMLTVLRERVRAAWVEGDLATVQVVASGLLLDAEVLTIGFARRFASYKRANLIFNDLERLKNLLLDTDRPVQIIFAGKAHPRDENGQELIRQVYRLALDPALAGRIAFAEDYDLYLAHFLVSGVDLWLNTPRPPMEASGTSGQKAALNGVPSFSTLDGWWLEAYNGSNGWEIGEDGGAVPAGGETQESIEERDAADAESIYATLEDVIVPLYYDRNGRGGVPEGWVEVMKEAIRTGGAGFSARRMLLEYIDMFYGKAAGSG